MDLQSPASCWISGNWRRIGVIKISTRNFAKIRIRIVFVNISLTGILVFDFKNWNVHKRYCCWILYVPTLSDRSLKILFNAFNELNELSFFFFWFYRLAQLVKVMIAVAIFITYSLQFYVPMEIIWKSVKHRFTSKQTLYEILLRILIVICTGKYHILNITSMYCTYMYSNFK